MYKPLPPYLTIKSSPIHGLGLYTNDDIPKGLLLGITHVRHMDFEDGYIRTPLGGFFNHSTTPNCEIVDKGEYLYLKTMRDISKGQELTAYYTLYEIK